MYHSHNTTYAQLGMRNTFINKAGFFVSFIARSLPLHSFSFLSYVSILSFLLLHPNHVFNLSIFKMQIVAQAALGLIAMMLLLHTKLALSKPAPPNSIAMKVANHAGSPIELFWVNNFGPKQELVKQTQTPIRNASETSINSYDTHMFMVKFLDPKKDKFKETFVKGPREEVINIYFNEVSYYFVLPCFDFILICHF